MNSSICSQRFFANDVLAFFPLRETETPVTATVTSAFSGTELARRVNLRGDFEWKASERPSKK